MDNDPKKAFRIAKKAVMENPTLTNYFAALCSQHSGLEGTKLKRALKLVYKMVLPKAIHSRFAVGSVGLCKAISRVTAASKMFTILNYSCLTLATCLTLAILPNQTN